MISDSPSLFRQIFWMFVMPVASLLAARASVLHYLDRPLTIEPPSAEEVADVFDAPREDGSWPDYRLLFDQRQERSTRPVEENGWREILRAFGPRAFGKDELVDTVAWDAFATDERSKDWFERVWTPHCQWFDLDPFAKPEFLERATLPTYLLARGATGAELPPETLEEARDYLAYYDGGVKRLGRLTKEGLQTCLTRLESNPWTSRQFPNAARWIEENSDLYERCSQAVRAPKFTSRRFLSAELGKAEDVDASDLLGFHELKRLFIVRANYRIASGDVSGAIDDVESVLLLARSLLDPPGRMLSDRFVALRFIESAVNVGVFANSSTQPTRTETERWISLWREQVGSLDIQETIRRAYADLRDGVVYPCAQDICRYRRERGSVAELFAQLTDNEEWKKKAEEERQGSQWLKQTFLLRPTFDDRYLMETLADEFRQGTTSTLQGESLALSAKKKFDGSGSRRRRVEAGLAFDLFHSTVEPIERFAETCRRVGCLVRVQALAGALLAYQVDRGSLPPAYTVDALGNPLHSWRVLILPYLGEKELYARFALDEPWDSETNAPLGDVAPEVFRCPCNFHSSKGGTDYSVILGQDSAFAYGGISRDLNSMRKRPNVFTNLQGLVVERSIPIAWTCPDSELDAHACRESFGQKDGVLSCRHSDGLSVGMASGAACARSFHPADPGTPVSAIAELIVSGR